MNVPNSTKKRVTDVDVLIGSRLRQARMLANLSQTQIAEFLGITFQQVQKYERGTNRVSAAVLHRLASMFGLPLAHFFDGTGPGSQDIDLAESNARMEFASSREGRTLIDGYQRCPPKVQATVLSLIVAASNSLDADDAATIPE